MRLLYIFLLIGKYQKKLISSNISPWFKQPNVTGKRFVFSFPCSLSQSTRFIHIHYSIASTNALVSVKQNSPDGHSPNKLDQSKWPLQPGVLVHINKMNHVSISTLSPRVSPFKTTSVSRRKVYLKYKRNKSKFYARLERLRELLGLSRRGDRTPEGIKVGAGGGK